MKQLDPTAIAETAIAAARDRPAVTVAHDHEHGRLVIFRIDPGQQVATHTNASSVFMFVVSGAGFVTGAAGEVNVRSGEVMTFAPNEPHGMRADHERLVIAAVIAPRSGGR